MSQHTVEIDLDGAKITIETGKVAKQPMGLWWFVREIPRFW